MTVPLFHALDASRKALNRLHYRKLQAKAVPPTAAQRRFPYSEHRTVATLDFEDGDGPLRLPGDTGYKGA